MKNKNICKAHPDDSPGRFHHFSLCHAREKQLVDQRKGNNAVMVSQVDGDNDEQEHMIMLASNDEGFEQGVDISEELYVADISSYSLGASDSKDINKEDKTDENFLFKKEVGDNIHESSFNLNVDGVLQKLLKAAREARTK